MIRVPALTALLALLALLGVSCASSSTGPAPGPAGQGRLEGRVFDTDSGSEVGGASVIARSESSTFQAFTGADGKWTLPAVPPGVYALSAVAPGFSPTRRSLVLGSRVALKVDLGLTPALQTGSLVGVVRDGGTGAPVAGAVAEVPAAGLRVLTDTTGRFVALGLNPGPVGYTIEAAGFRPDSGTALVLRNDTTLVNVSLLANTGSIVGTVFSTAPGRADRPLAGAEVSLLGTTRTTSTDTAGQYRLELVPEGTAVIRVEALGHDRSVTSTGVARLTTTRHDIFARSALTTVRGTVRRPNGQPAPGATVSLPSLGLTTTTTRDTANPGAYVFPGNVEVPNLPSVVVINGIPFSVPPRQLPLAADLPGFITARSLIDVVPETATVADLVLVSGTGALSGTVREQATAAAIGGAVVSLPLVGLTTFSQGTGAYRFDSVPASVQRVETRAAGFSPSATAVVILAGVETTTDLFLTAPASLTGSVVQSSTGAGVAGATVSIPVLGVATLTDGGGRFVLSELPAGTLDISVVSASTFPATTQVVLVPGAGLDVRIVVGP